ncbi:MAG: hypothetical protein L0216_22005 [Planctomycetales bacterium]|nr:hypothetical protein [Planctomycetales bacterium]
MSEPFVIQAHDAPPLHYDLMLRRGEALKTWGLPEPPSRDPGRVVAVEAKPDHRLDYLTYEGPVSGNRGAVKPWDSGTYETLCWEDGRVEVALEGGKVRGAYRLLQERGVWYLAAMPPSPGPAREPPAARLAAVQERLRAGKRRARRIVAALLGLAVLILLGGLSYHVAAGRYRRAYHEQAYIEILDALTRRIPRDLEVNRPGLETDLRRRRIGSRATVIGLVGGLHADAPGGGSGEPRLFVDVPNLIEEANGSPEDVLCSIPAGWLEPIGDEGGPGDAGDGGGHRHRLQRHDLVVVEGTIRTFTMVNSHLRLDLSEATLREPGPVERHFWSREARTLGTLQAMPGISNPKRAPDERPSR